MELETRKEVLKSYAAFCDYIIIQTNNKWTTAEQYHFRINRQTEKACYVNFRITDMREFDNVTGERVYPERTFQDDTYIQFWCPKKFMGWNTGTIPYWFVKEKIQEFLAAN